MFVVSVNPIKPIWMSLSIVTFVIYFTLKKKDIENKHFPKEKGSNKWIRMPTLVYITCRNLLWFKSYQKKDIRFSIARSTFCTFS